MKLDVTGRLPGPVTRLAPVFTERRRWQPAALLVRLAQLVAGGLVLLALPDPRPLVLVLLVAGVLAAVIGPARSGPAIALVAGVAGWVFGHGAHGSPSVAGTLAFALALFLLYDASALAGTVPVTAHLRREVLLGWLRRDAITLLVAALLTALVYGAHAVAGYTSSYPLQVLGLLGVVVVLGAAAWLYSRSVR
ncbi:MAG TPA: hypothetical protein VMB79_16175 [Jatrophihabitans sp.]|nr:hypothetical protein [Jatrophihabitans sp.]